MPDRTHAAVELDGSTLRFAEVDPATGTLLRLGRIALDFGVQEALGSAGDDRDALTQALADAFSGATPETLTVVLHPAGIVTWSVPLDRATDADTRRTRLRREAAELLGDREADSALHATALYDDGQTEWQLVMAIPMAWAEALRSISTYVNDAAVHIIPAAKAVLQALPPAGRVLAVGVHDSVTEVALRTGPDVTLVGHAPTSDPADAAFTTLSLLGRTGHHGSTQAPLDALVLFGAGATPSAAAAFEGALGAPVQPLDPFGRLAAPPHAFSGADAFGAVVGAALG